MFPQHAAIDILAWTVLIAVVLSCGVLFWLGKRRTQFNFLQYCLFLVGIMLARGLWRGRVEGELPPLDGSGAVIVCNHRGPFDPAFIQIGVPRVIHWMVAREYVEKRSLSWFFRIAQYIPAGRGGIDTAATKMAIRYAKVGELVGMFPEGRLNMTDKLLLPGRPGAALIALKARVPVVPCYVTGTPRGKTILTSFFAPAKARLKIGRPIDISEYYGREREREVLEDLTKSFLREIAKLAGVEDFEPELAGRNWRPEE